MKNIIQGEKVMNKKNPERLYNIIITELANKKIKRYMLAQEIGMKNSTFSDQLNKLKKGEYIPIPVLLAIGEVLGKDLIFFA